MMHNDPSSFAATPNPFQGFGGALPTYRSNLVVVAIIVAIIRIIGVIPETG
jgi:hypothetical protein